MGNSWLLLANLPNSCGCLRPGAALPRDAGLIGQADLDRSKCHLKTCIMVSTLEVVRLGELGHFLILQFLHSF